MLVLQLELGAALPLWIQAQTTYAKLKKDDEGHWGLQIIKQKIWVGGTSYELQVGFRCSGSQSNVAGTVCSMLGDILSCGTSSAETLSAHPSVAACSR